MVLDKRKSERICRDRKKKKWAKMRNVTVDRRRDAVGKKLGAAASELSLLQWGGHGNRAF